MVYWFLLYTPLFCYNHILAGMPICEHCSVRHLCAFLGCSESIEGQSLDNFGDCVHFVCPEGRRKARDDRSKSAKNPVLKKPVLLESGETILATPTGAGNKTHDKAGWYVDDEGHMVTRNSKQEYRISGQNVRGIQEWKTKFDA